MGSAEPHLLCYAQQAFPGSSPGAPTKIN